MLFRSSEFTAYLVHECEPDELKECEVFWIQNANTCDRSFGYNLTKGGEDLGSLTEEAKETKRLNRIGKSSSLKGKKQSEEWVKARVLKTKGVKRNYTKEHITAIKKTRAAYKGRRQKGKEVILTDNTSGIIQKFNSKREAEDFLGMKRDTLIHKFYKGRPRVIFKKITYLNYTIERT